MDHVYLEIKSAASHTSSTLRERFYHSLILLARSCCVLLVAPSFADEETTYHSYVFERWCQQRNHQTKRLTTACIQARTYSVEVKCRRTMMAASSITSSVMIFFTSSLEAPPSYLDGILKNPSRFCAVFQRRA